MAANQINDTDFDSKFFNYKNHHDRGITYSNYFNRNISTVNNYNNTSDSIYHVGSGNLTENLLIPLLLSSSLSSSSSSSPLSSITTTTTAATITSTLASAADTTFGTRKTIKSPSIFLPSLSSSLSSLTSSVIDDIDKNLTLSEYGSTITSTSILTTSNRNLNELQEHHNQHQQEKFNYTENEILSHLYEELFSWQGICLVMVFCAFIVITIIGNTLVILAVITTRRLRTVTNCFVMSLAVADLLVGIFVMPPAVAVHLIGSWQLGWVLCDIWISLDVLLCTASILSLCAISVDRYLAVTQPLTYSRKRRSKRLALIMILVVWFLALAITCPPILGWYEPGRREEVMECRYNQNEGYVIFSAMGSFFIPMSVMIYVYARISCVVASRHDKMADIGVHNNKFKRYPHDETENEQDCSEQDSTGICNKKLKAGRTLSNQTIIKDLQDTIIDDNEIARQCKNGSYELVTTSTSSRTPSFKRTPSLNAKYSSVVITTGASGGGVSIGTNVNSANTGNGSSLNLSAEHWTFGNRQHSIRHHLHHNNHHHHQHNHHHHLHTTSICNNDKYNSSSGTTTTVIRNTRVHQKSITNRITSLKRENKTTQTLSIVVGGFIACWLPFFIYYLMTPFLTEESVNPALGKFLTWLGWFNSAINPFIYAFYSVDFRAAFWRLTLKRFIKNSQKVQFPNTMSMRR